MAGPESTGREKRKRREPFDYSLLLVVLILVGFGLVMLYSTSSWNGQVKFADKAYYLKKQFFATSLGLAAMYACFCPRRCSFSETSTTGRSGGSRWGRCPSSPRNSPSFR